MKARERPEIKISYSTSVVINDQHIPFHDKQINTLVFAFIKDFKPDYVDVLGDLMDFWQLCINGKFIKTLSLEMTVLEAALMSTLLSLCVAHRSKH